MRARAGIMGLAVAVVAALGAGAPVDARPGSAAGRGARRTSTVPPVAEVARESVDPLTRAQGREGLMQTRAVASERRARAQALLAYRLARRRATDFGADSARRAARARALEAALLILRRSAVEATALRRELAHARTERAALERHVIAGARVPAQPVAAALLGQLDDDNPVFFTAFLPLPGPSLVWPARGTLVSGPGWRRDPATGTEAVFEGVELLSRMNEPVRAVAAGRVAKIAALPQGGYAVVTEHDDGRISILSGLRQISVSGGAAVEAGQPLGLMGRDLDGAPVLVFELWREGAPVDPRPLLPAAPPR